MKALAEGQPHTHLELRRTDSFGKRCFEISGKEEPGSVFRGLPVLTAKNLSRAQVIKPRRNLVLLLQCCPRRGNGCGPD